MCVCVCVDGAEASQRTARTSKADEEEVGVDAVHVGLIHNLCMKRPPPAAAVAAAKHRQGTSKQAARRGDPE